MKNVSCENLYITLMLEIFMLFCLQVGFVGLGNMGLPMASNLVKGDVKVSAYDMNANAVKTLEKEGAVAVDGLSDIAQQTTVITMLPAG